MCRSLVILGVLGGLGLAGGCERIPQICEDSCKQAARCDPGFFDYGYSIRDCRSDCEDSLEDEQENLEADCGDAVLDYYACQASLSCAELQDPASIACVDEATAMGEACAQP